MTTKAKTNKQQAAEAADPIALLMANMTAMMAEIQALSAKVNADPVPVTGTAKGKGKAAKKADPKTDAKKAEAKAKYAAIDANKALWVEKYDLKKAVALAKAEAAKNEAAGYVNANILANSPNSRRRFLTSATNQALKAVREKANVKANVVETMLSA